MVGSPGPDDRVARVEAIQRRLGRRRLVWFGTRGEDATALCDVEQFAAAYSYIAPLRSRPTVEALALEELAGARPDLDTYDVDHHLRSPSVAALREAMLATLAQPTALVTYRPSAFLSAITFTRLGRCRYLGMFKGHQDAFEHKPWVETSLAGLGIAVIPWRYVPNSERDLARRMLDEGPVMLRTSRTTGGVGLTKATDPATLDALWPDEDDAYVSVAPFLADCLPLNVGAVVWSGGVSVHHASVQLIGVPGCTGRPFGYCGNDFALASSLGRGLLDEIEATVVRIGRWMATLGYRGAFGVDFLLRDGELVFTEVNPRLQGSTHASCRLSVESGLSCVLTDHLAANLTIPFPGAMPLFERMHGAELSHVVLHNISNAVLRPDPVSLVDRVRQLPGFSASDLVALSPIAVQPGGAVVRITFRRQVTSSGYDLLSDLSAALAGSIGDARSAGSG